MRHIVKQDSQWMMVLVSCCWEKRELETFSSVGFPFGGLICDACAVGSKFAPIYRTMRKTSKAQPWIWINANVDFSNISYLWHLIWLKRLDIFTLLIAKTAVIKTLYYLYFVASFSNVVQCFINESSTTACLKVKQVKS